MGLATKERAKARMLMDLANTAFDRILAQDFESLTVEDIAASVGMSRATFFRHYGSKEGVVVAAILGTTAEFAEAYRTAQGPALSWARLRAAVEPAVMFVEQDPANMRARMAFLAGHPAIAAKLRAERQPQIAALAEAMMEAGGDPFACRIRAHAAVATCDQCFIIWKTEGRPMRDLVDDAFRALARG